MGRHKSNIKIRTIKSNGAKITQKNNFDTSISLEDEVASDDLPSESQSSSREINPSIRGSNAVQIIPTQSTTSQVNQNPDNQQLFSQSRIYSSSSSQEVPQRTSYVSAEQSSRNFNPSIVSSSQPLPTLSRDISFASPERSNVLDNSKDREYHKPLDMSSEQKRKRMPWE